MLKRHQRAFGGLYQSVLRAELTHRFGVAFGEIVNGQAEIAGVPAELMEVFSKRAVEVRDELEVKVADYRHRHGCEPSRVERAAMEREASADTRQHKTGHSAADLRRRWLTEAAAVDVTPESLQASIAAAGRAHAVVPPPSAADVVDVLADRRSVWHRMDVLRTITDLTRPQPDFDGERWARALERATDLVLDRCIDLDPEQASSVRVSDGRSVLIEPSAPQVTSRRVLDEEEAILAWTHTTQKDPPTPSPTVNGAGLDVLQADATAAVAGSDRLAVVVGPAGTGKTTMLAAAVADLNAHGRAVFGVAPTAKAARVLERETGMRTDTLAKLLHEHARPDGPHPDWRLRPGATVIVDEAGMVSTPDLHRLMVLADREGWRLALIGDPRQLQAVGRGGMFAEICTTARAVELERVHRFTHDWEADASLRLRAGDPTVLDIYDAHGRIRTGSLEEHLASITTAWLTHDGAGETVAITAATNDHVDAINDAIQHGRVAANQLHTDDAVAIAGGGRAHVGDVIATRRNRRDLVASDGQPVRNRDLWTITATSEDGSVTARRHGSDATVVLPADYMVEHVRLGYAATEHGNQGDTRTASITLATPVTTSRGLYVGMTRGRERNEVLVVTGGHISAEAHDILNAILATDRADNPAVAHCRTLDAHTPSAPPVLQPRCEVPDWLATIRAQTAASVVAAQRELDDATARQQHTTHAIEHAEQRLRDATEACAPWDRHLADARNVLAERTTSRDDAQPRLDNGGLRHRRRNRGDLASAVDAQHDARTVVERLQRDAQPVVDARTRARTELERLRTDRMHDKIVDRWTYRPERLHQSRELLDALDTWHRWASGHPIVNEQLARAVNTLVEQSSEHPGERATARARDGRSSPGTLRSD